MDLKELEHVAANHPLLNADALVDLGTAYSLLCRPKEAEAAFSRALTLEPNHDMALLHLAGCLFQRAEIKRARRLLERAAAARPRELPPRLALARLHLHQEDIAAAQAIVDAAVHILQQTHSEMPDDQVKYHIEQLRYLQLTCWVRSDQSARAEAWLDGKRPQVGSEEYVYLLSHYAAQLAGQDRPGQAEEVIAAGLKQYPDSVVLLLQLAELSEIQGRFLPAIGMVRRATRLDPENPALWSRLSTVCLHRIDRQARTAAEKALELAQKPALSDQYPPMQIAAYRAQAKTALAQVECHEQNFERSEALFRQVLDDHPLYIPALQGLGQQYMQQGRIEAALEVYETIKQVDPLKAHSALINARHFPQAVEALEKMEEMARTPSLEGRVRSGLLFQLAAAWEKRQDFHKAFDFARRANAAGRKFLSYDAGAHRNRCARIRRVFCKALYDHRKGGGIDSTLPVYVLGMPRSGTTLVEQIIAGHSRIFGAGELGVIPRRIAGLDRWERHVGSGRSYPDCIDDLTPYVTAGIARGILEELKGYDPRADHIVDKLPHNFENIGLIKFLFPRARIISVRRDPRDIALSNYFTNYQAKHGGMGFAYDLTDIGEQLADHNLLMHHWHRLFPGEILEIHYEEVVDDLEGSARRLLDYIGVDWEPQVLKFNELDRPVKTASVWQVRQPIYNTSKAKWKRYEGHLAPLIKGTNAKISPDPIEDMITLPRPGFLTDGVDLFKKGNPDGAELSFKKMLHHNPDHAAAAYMLGLVYLNKGYLREGIELLERALEKCPWQREWRDNLIKACRVVGDHDRADGLKAQRRRRFSKPSGDTAEDWVSDRFRPTKEEIASAAE